MKKIRYLLMSTIAVAASSMPTYAQSTPAAPDNAPVTADTTAGAKGSDAANAPASADIVVTGHAGAGIRKLAAGYSITTISSSDIAIQNPKSTGDLLKSVPGVWVESSGGVGTSNVFVRGIPTTGDAPFVTMQLDGLPVYGANSPSFMDQTALIRVDETVQGVEGVNGGPASLFSDGQPGLTTNLLIREGHEVSEGSVKISATDYGQRRIDGFLSGKLTDNTYYMVGGYFQSGDTVRKAGFDTELGGQITVNLTHKFDIGKINVFARYTDDHGEWFLPFAANVPGINKGTYNQLNNLNRIETIVTPGTGPNGPLKTVDIGDGRGWKGVIAGGNLSLNLGQGLDFVDKLGYTKGTLRTEGLVPQGAGAITVGTALASGFGTPQQTVVSGIHTAQALNNNDYVQQFGAWDIQKDLSAISNEATLSLNSGPNKLTGGYYFNHFRSNDKWSLGNNYWMQVGGFGDVVNLDNSQANVGGFNIADFGSATENAFYLADSLNITPRLRVDGGVRYQMETIKFRLNNASVGSSAQLNIKRHNVPWTVGADYRAADSLHFYARATTGYHFATFDDVRDQIGNTGPATDNNLKVLSFEGGAKFHVRGVDAALSVFWDKVSGVNYQDVGSNVAGVVAGSKTPGLEFAGTWTSDFGLSITTDDTLENPKTWAPGIVQSGVLIDGKQAERIPKYQARITPAFKVGNPDNNATIYATFEAIGKRYGDLGNTQDLPAYQTLSAGILVMHKGVSLQVAGDNLTNSHGLTEGNPRFVGGAGVTLPDIRPIFGRSFRFTAGYKF
jgi:iron complex outermembrane receptor protein